MMSTSNRRVHGTLGGGLSEALPLTAQLQHRKRGACDAALQSLSLCKRFPCQPREQARLVIDEVKKRYFL